MKTKKINILFVIAFMSLFILSDYANAQFVITQKSFEPNSASTYFTNTGVFNQNISFVNAAGYMWPKNSNKTAIFTTGFNIIALVNDSIRMAAASYKGEYRPGYTTNCNPFTDTNFRVYKIKRGDNAGNNPDYANWGAMVPFGAPYFDVNNNGQYDPGIDKPGVRGANQTIFICLTDGFIESHTSGEGFGGGTLPLYADLRITAWGYDIPWLEDVQFIKFNIINKNVSSWTHTFMGLYADPDVGDPSDDFIGYDPVRKLGYCYNADNDDPVYGIAPPAVGFLLLKGAVNHSIIPNVSIGLTSFNYCSNATGTPSCETDPGSDQISTFNYLKGFKKDGSPFMNPTTNPYSPTKFVYTGSPESNSGWTESQGSIQNCGGTTGPLLTTNPGGDRRLIMGMGAENFTMAPGDTQTILIPQLIARGSSNLNSVTKLIALANSLVNLNNNGFNLFSTVSGNVKYSDNNQTVTSGSVKAMRLDSNSGQIIILDSTGIQPDGSYTLNNIPEVDLFIGAVPNSSPPADYVPTYYPATICWQNATVINTVGNLTGIDIQVYRMSQSAMSNQIIGTVNSSAPVNPLKDAVVYAKSGDSFVGYSYSVNNGIYSINSLPVGNLKLIADRIGYKCDSLTVNLSNDYLDSVNFYLNALSVGINTISTEIPDKYILYQNYPNPFNPITKIKYQIKNNGFVTLKVYNILGKAVSTLINKNQNAGTYEVEFDASGLASGLYLYKITTGNYTETKKMVLIR